MLPITSQLWPNNVRKLIYLAEVAVLTRLATGIARVLENSPSKQHDPNQTESEKRQAMAERVFVELIGTGGYMACLHLGQDVVDKVRNRYFKPGLPSLKNLKPSQDLKASLGDDLKNLNRYVNRLDSLLKNVYEADEKGQVKNSVFKTLYEHDIKIPKSGSNQVETIQGKANLATLKEQFHKEFNPQGLAKDGEKLEKAFQAIVHEVQPLKALARKNNFWAAGAVAAGVGLSALVGGTVIQWMNDRVVAPSAKKFFTRKEMEKSQANAVSQKNAQPANAVPHKPISFLSAAPTIPMAPTLSAPMMMGGYAAIPRSNPIAFAANPMRPNPLFMGGYR